MDLAKIRKKSLLTSDYSEVESAPAIVLPDAVMRMLDATPVVPAVSFPVLDSTEVQEAKAPRDTNISSAAVAAFIPTPRVADPLKPLLSPLEAILEGRMRAGCDDDLSQIEDATVQIVQESHLEFLCFRVSDEIYGINIMDIKEIIKPREVTEVPRAPVFVSGVLSLRGTIIPIIDMRLRLGLQQEETTSKERIVVIKSDSSFSGLLVDEVIQVVQVPAEAIEAAPTVLDGIDRDFVSGIGRSDGRLMIILNLENIANIHLY